MSRPPLNVLDVRPIRSRHIVAVVRAAVERLDAGGSFVLVYDRNPDHLYRELEEDGVTVSWEIIKRRPGEWRVRVSCPDEKR